MNIQYKVLAHHPFSCFALARQFAWEMRRRSFRICSGSAFSARSYARSAWYSSRVRLPSILPRLRALRGASGKGSSASMARRTSAASFRSPTCCMLCGLCLPVRLTEKQRDLARCANVCGSYHVIGTGRHTGERHTRRNDHAILATDGSNVACVNPDSVGACSAAQIFAEREPLLRFG